MTPALRRAFRALAIAATIAVAGGAGVLAAAPASAHAHLTATSPAEDAALATPPSRVTLSFDEDISHAAVAVQGPDGGSWLEGEPITTDKSVTQALRPLGPAGAYTVNYRVVSADGHTVQGSFVFTLTAAGPSRAAPRTAAPATGASGSGPASASPIWPVLLVALAIAAVIGLWMVAGRRIGDRARRRTDGHTDGDGGA